MTKKEVPTFTGRLYTDTDHRGFAGNWVRRAEVDALLEEIARLRKALNNVRKAEQELAGVTYHIANDALAGVDTPEPLPSRPAYDNLLKHVTSEWATEKNDMQMTVHHRMIEGVLCRWWGDGPAPDGVALIDKACALKSGVSE